GSYRDRLDLDPRTERQGGDLERRSRRRRVTEEARVDRVERGEVADVRKEAGRLDDIVERERSRLEDGRQVEQHALGLCLDAALDEGAGRRIDAELSCAEDEAGCADRLA